MTLAATAETAAHSTDSLVYSFTLQTAVPSVELKLLAFGLLLTILLSQVCIHYSAYYSAK